MNKKIIYGVKFMNFSETPLSAREIIKEFNSLDVFDIINYEYYLVSDYDETENKLKYYIIVPLTTKKLKNLSEKLVTIEGSEVITYEGIQLLIIPIEDDNQLLTLLKRIETKIKSMEDILDDEQFYVNVTENDVVIDKKNGVIEVMRIPLTLDNKIVEFVIFSDYFNIGRVMFVINDFIVFKKDGTSILTRFKKIQKPRDLPKSSIIVEITIPKNVKDKIDVIKHRINILIEDITKYNDIKFLSLLKLIEETMRNKGFTFEQIEQVKESVLTEKLDIMFNVRDSNELSMRVLTYDGELYTNSIIQEFVFEKFISEYYVSLMVKTMNLINSMKPEETKKEISQPITPRKNVTPIIRQVKNEQDKKEKTEPTPKEEPLHKTKVEEKPIVEPPIVKQEEKTELPRKPITTKQDLPEEKKEEKKSIFDKVKPKKTKKKSIKKEQDDKEILVDVKKISNDEDVPNEIVVKLI